MDWYNLSGGQQLYKYVPPVSLSPKITHFYHSCIQNLGKLEGRIETFFAQQIQTSAEQLRNCNCV